MLPSHPRCAVVRDEVDRGRQRRTARRRVDDVNIICHAGFGGGVFLRQYRRTAFTGLEAGGRHALPSARPDAVADLQRSHGTILAGLVERTDQHRLHDLNSHDV